MIAAAVTDAVGCCDERERCRHFAQNNNDSDLLLVTLTLVSLTRLNLQGWLRANDSPAVQYPHQEGLVPPLLWYGQPRRHRRSWVLIQTEHLSPLLLPSAGKQDVQRQQPEVLVCC